MKALKLLLILLLPLLFANTAFALSCALPPQRIGVVVDFKPENSYYTILLKDVQSFEISNILKNDFYSIDEYENIVQNYIDGKKLLELPEYTWNPNSTSIPAIAFEKIEIKRGDILIQGPPPHICDYRFFGIFSSDGHLKYVIINDEFSDYSYNEIKIEVSPGKEIKCNNDYCKVQVDYKVANEKFTLSLKQSYSPKATAFNSFTLLDSSNYNPRNDDIQASDWGKGKYLTYVITFSESTDEDKCVEIKRPDDKTGCQYTPVYDDNGKCVIDYEEKCEVEDSKNVFGKFIDWLKSFFANLFR